eukprot:Colp12_sorted_trinity150504_noHs@9854
MALQAEEFETAIKVVIVGNGRVGKSSMIQRYCKGIFTKDYKKTIGVDFLEKEINSEGEDVRMMLWDTAGQEEFDSITSSYYRGAQACVLAFSTIDRDSFLAVEKWKKKVEAECGEDIAMVLVQNKIDLLDQAVITPQEAEGLAKRLQLRFYRTSVKEDILIDDVFSYLAKTYIDKMRRVAKDETTAKQKIGMFQTRAAEEPGEEQQPTTNFQLTRPSKMRTGGKKRPLCIIL